MSQKTDICRLCLSIEVRMVSIANTPLQAVFEKITDSLLYTEDTRPVVACYICYAQLKKCHKLMLRSIQAENVLTEIIQSYPKVTMKSVALIDREAKHLSDPLSIVSLDCFEYYMQTPIGIKQEPETVIPEVVTVKIETECEDTQASPEPPDIEHKLAVEDTKPLNVFNTGPQIDTANMLEVRIITGEDGAPLQYLPPEIQQRKEITYMYPQSPVSSTGDKCYQCDQCQCVFNRKLTLKTHIITHTSEKPCDDCQRKFKRKQTMERHKSTHTGEKPYKCTVCKRGFNQGHHLRDHLLIHTGERLHKCNICNITFEILSSLKRHFNMVHNLYQCNICGCEFKCITSYNAHLKSHNSEQGKIHECIVCQRRFGQKNYLNRHMRVHTGEKPYECSVCNRRFSEKHNLNYHLKTQHKEKPAE